MSQGSFAVPEETGTLDGGPYHMFLHISQTHKLHESPPQISYLKV